MVGERLRAWRLKLGAHDKPKQQAQAAVQIKQPELLKDLFDEGQMEQLREFYDNLNE